LKLLRFRCDGCGLEMALPEKPGKCPGCGEERIVRIGWRLRFKETDGEEPTSKEKE